MKILHWVTRLSAVIVLGAGLVACGGGGGGAASGNSGSIAVAVTDGPGDDYSHVWVTVKQIAFHTDANAVWNPSDATWKVYALPTPVTVDLAALNNGQLSNMFGTLSLPTGTYRQIRFFLDGQDDALQASAQAITSNASGTPALAWNDQVEYISSTGTVSEAPLEIANAKQGIQLNGTFTITSGSTLSIVVDFDLEHDIVRFHHGSQTAFTMRPNLKYYDLSQVGAITGQVNPAALCPQNYTSRYATTSNSSNCGYNLIVKAEILSADGTRHVDARATTVKSDGSFVLFPLPANVSSYDVLVRGRNIPTSLITNVPVTSGTTPTSGATVIPEFAVTPALGNEYFANLSAGVNPTSSWILFDQSFASVGGGLPYEVRWGNTNPFTGVLENPEALQLGSVNIAPYQSGSLNFTATTPTQGAGNYTVASNSTAYYNASGFSTLTSVAAAGSTTFTVANPQLNTALAVQGSVTGTISLGTTAQSAYNNGYLVFARFANIMNSEDISSSIAGGSISYTLNLPAGSPSMTVPGAYYYAYLVLWNSAHPISTLTVVPFNGYADLRSSTTLTGFNVSD